MKERTPVRLKDHVLRIAGDYNWTFVFVMVLTLVSCAFSIHYLSSLEADLKDVYENDVRGADSMQLASRVLASIESAAKDQFIDDTRSLAASKAEVRGLEARLKKAVDSSDPRFYTPKARQAYLATKEHLADYLVALDGFAAKAVPDKASLTKVIAAGDVLQKDFDLLIANRIANSRKGIADLFFELRFSLAVTIGILVVSIGVRVVLYYAGHPRRKKNLPPPTGCP